MEKEEKPFYQKKEFWLDVAKILAQAGIAFGTAYLTQKGKR